MKAHAYLPTTNEAPRGLCECGCGQRTPIAKATYRYKRNFRGYPMPYLRGHAPKQKQQRRGAGNPGWKGGRYTDKSGYVHVLVPEHHLADRYGYVLEHRLVMEQKLGRPLEKGEISHHINHDRSDNRPENLMLMTRGQHTRLHATGRSYGEDTRKKMSESGKKGAAKRWNVSNS